MADDISNKTVLLLLVLTILISVVGTLIVLEEANKVKIASSQTTDNVQSPQPSSNVGLIKVNIQKPPAELQGGAG